MNCPQCESDKTRVQETRYIELGGIDCPRRRRKCDDCGHGWYTVEIPTEWVEEQR